MNIVAIMIGIPEKLQQYNKKIPNHLKARWKFVNLVGLLTSLALNVTMFLEIAKGQHCANTKCKYIIIFAFSGQEQQIVMAHYLLFSALAVEPIFIGIVYIFAKWLVTRFQLANDMLVMYKDPTAAPVNDHLMNAPAPRYSVRINFSAGPAGLCS